MVYGSKIADIYMIYGISNCFYAVRGKGGYSTPSPLKYAVEADIKSNKVSQTAKICGIERAIGHFGDGYAINLKLYELPSHFLQAVLHYTKENGILKEISNVNSVHFALMFETKENKRFEYPDCCCLPPNFDVSTVTDTITMNPFSLSIAAVPRPTDMCVQAFTTDETPKEIYLNWFNAVQV